MVLFGTIALLLPTTDVSEIDLAPDFRFVSYDSLSYSLHDLRGNAAVINFWATWCEPCVEEAPLFAHAWTHYGVHGVKFMGIVVDDNQQAAEAFARLHALTYPLGEDTDLSRLFSVSSIPTTFILDANGAIHKRFNGAVSQKRFLDEIEAVLIP